MKTTSKILTVCILLVISGQALAIGSQANTEQKAELLQHQVFRFLVVLDFILTSGKRCRILIPEDAVDKENHRRLRAALRADNRLDSAK